MSTESLTSSRNGTLYFGYGSNLSAFQMSKRCPSSGTPIAIAKLNSWFWIISERGYANLIPMPPAPVHLDTDATTVWGIVYNLTPEDESTLDMYEGWSSQDKGSPNPIAACRSWKPFEQGNATYNKMYLPVKVEKWLVQDPKSALGISEDEYDNNIIRSLVYVDEHSVLPGRIKPSYIRRMSRSARECIAMGVPERWVNNMFSQHGIDPNHKESFTEEIRPDGDAQPPAKQQWESIRQQYLQKGDT